MLYFLVNFLPSYLMEERGLSIMGMAGIASTTYVAQAAAALLAGMLLDRLRQHQDSSGQHKRLLIAGFVVLAGGVIAAAAARTPALITACVIVSGAGLGVLHVANNCAGQRFAGPLATGRWCGIQNCVGNFVGIVVPLAVGGLVDMTGSYIAAFVLTAALQVFGIIAVVFILPRIEAIDWSRAEAPRMDSAAAPA